MSNLFAHSASYINELSSKNVYEFRGYEDEVLYTVTEENGSVTITMGDSSARFENKKLVENSFTGYPEGHELHSIFKMREESGVLSNEGSKEIVTYLQADYYKTAMFFGTGGNGFYVGKGYLIISSLSYHTRMIVTEGSPEVTSAGNNLLVKMVPEGLSFALSGVSYEGEKPQASSFSPQNLVTREINTVNREKGRML